MRIGNSPEYKAYQRRYRQTHKEKQKEYRRIYYQSHGEEEREYQRRFYQEHLWERKTEVLTHYGNGKCVCVMCGFGDIRALSIDHINGNAGGRSRERTGRNLYDWLKKNGYPSGFQTLCMNCQFIKRVENKESRRRQ